MDKTAVRLVSAFDTIDELVFCGLMLTLPFGWQLSIVPNVLFLVLIFRKALLDSQKPSKEKLLYFTPIFVFLIISLLSLLYSDDAGGGADILFKRLNLFVLPLGFLFSDFHAGLAKRGVRFFILGSLLASIITLIIAFSNSILLKEQMLCIAPIFHSTMPRIMDTDIFNNHFYGVDLSFFMHPSYFGFMLSVAIMALLNSYVKEEGESWIIQYAGIPGFVFMSLSVVLLSTNGVVLSTLALVAFILFFAARYRQLLDMFSSWLVVFAILMSTGLFFNPQIQKLLQNESLISLTNKQKTLDASLQLISEHPVLGVGIGDVDDELTQVYKEKGYHDHAMHRLNPHNQFLQAYMGMGIVGFVSLLWMFFTLIRHGIKHRSMFIWGFALLGIIGFSFESMLNRYWGVLFFALFYSLFYNFPETISEEED